MVKAIQVFCFGEILWDNLPTGRRMGGAPLNVCYHLNQQGIPAAIISQVGADDAGIALMAGMKKLAVPTDFVTVDPALLTSTVEVLLQEDGQASYTIVEDVAWDAIPFRKDVAEELAKAEAFVFGSLASRKGASRQSLLAYLPYARWAIFDMNLRAPFIEPDFIVQLIAACHTLKVNEEELYTLAEWLALPAGDEQEIIDTLWLRYPNLREVLLTKGAAGASYYSPSATVDVAGIAVQVKDTIGSGDSFLAAFIAQTLVGATTTVALQQAVFLSAFVASKEGACPSYSSSEIAQIKV
mgnify:CR=1 FL=1